MKKSFSGRSPWKRSSGTRPFLLTGLTSQSQNSQGEHAAFVDGGLTDIIHDIMSENDTRPN
jgi:hypothetical protein